MEPDPVTNNNDRRQVTILPRQRSVQDLPAPRNILAGGSGKSLLCRAGVCAAILECIYA